MKRLALFFLLFTAYYLPVYSQQNRVYDKLGASLKILLADKAAQSAISSTQSEKKIAILIETGKPSSAAVLIKSGFALRTTMGTVSTADISTNNIYKLAQMKEVKRIELPLLLKKQDTLMRRFTNVEAVLKGQSPLNSSYSGKNLLIGIIDDGVDISHPDFYDANGKIRIKHLWNMDYPDGHPPQGYSYGNEWNADSLEYYGKQFVEKKIGIYPMQLLFGYSFHGTSVTSLAAGNNNGVAPDAEIVSVAFTSFTDTVLSSDRVIDAVAYIYRIAQEENKKCIINMSFGVMSGGPHDGKTLLEKAIDNFCYERPDLLVCTSAGNAGNDWKHWGGFPIDKDSSFGFFSCAAQASLYFSIPRNDSKNLKISIGEAKRGDINNPNISRDSMYYQSPFLNIDSLINSPAPAKFKSHFANGKLSSDITFAASHYNDDYDELILTTYEHSTTNTMFDEHLYRFILKGTGTVHAWYPFLNLHPIYFFDRNPYPNDPTYHNTNNEYSTVIPTNAFTVLSSGAYNLRTCYVNMHNNIVYGYEKCRQTYFTSRGPTLDGRIKPDIMSPGENVLVASSRFNDYYGHEFFIDTNTVAFSGTSASSPITAGVAALIWEKYPNYTRSEIIQLIKSSANFDSYAAALGPQPNNIAGWGKIDAFNALTGVRIDNSAACAEQDVCISKPVPPDTVITTNYNYFNIFPNPVHGAVNIHYISNRFLNCFVFDALGRLMKTIQLPPVSSGRTTTFNVQGFAKGIYFLHVTGSETSFTKKILVE